MGVHARARKVHNVVRTVVEEEDAAPRDVDAPRRVPLHNRRYCPLLQAVGLTDYKRRPNTALARPSEAAIRPLVRVGVVRGERFERRGRDGLDEPLPVEARRARRGAVGHDTGIANIACGLFDAGAACRRQRQLPTAVRGVVAAWHGGDIRAPLSHPLGALLACECPVDVEGAQARLHVDRRLHDRRLDDRRRVDWRWQRCIAFHLCRRATACGRHRVADLLRTSPRHLAKHRLHGVCTGFVSVRSASAAPAPTRGQRQLLWRRHVIVVVLPVPGARQLHVAGFSRRRVAVRRENVNVFRLKLVLVV
mmetsp:Transcript_17603/g.48301  ORF Transcript_17603/g.48301 Transcript_17603/m.48301 type:complete len:307 (+) Transcript_17603:253-1173(+)